MCHVPFVLFIYFLYSINWRFDVSGRLVSQFITRFNKCRHHFETLSFWGTLLESDPHLALHPALFDNDQLLLVDLSATPRWPL